MNEAPRRVLRWLGSHRGLPLALLVGAGALALQPPPRPLEDQPSDSWVYDAMAENPSVFTAQPWGYRILGPSLVHALPGGVGFAQVSLAALVLAAGLLFLYLRRLGHGEAWALLAAAAFGLSAPVREGVQNPFLCEPFSVLVETAFLLAVESEAGLGVLALAGVLCALSKEILLVLLPLVYFSRRERVGRVRALLDAALVALPALVVTLLLRRFWTPHLRSLYPVPGLSVLSLVLPALRRGRTGFLLLGIMPLAALGALRAKAGRFRRIYGLVALAFVVLPFVAWAYDPRPGRSPFFAETVRRLLIYALPLLLPLALVALDRVLPNLSPRPEGPPRPRRLLNAGAALAALVLATCPLWAFDPYRRIQLNRGAFYGPVVRSICHKTLKVAAQLENGQAVSYFEGAAGAPRIRWFLRDGWGSYPYYDTGEALLKGGEGSLLLPCLRPRDLEIVLSLRTKGPCTLRVEVNGVPLGRLTPRPEIAEHGVRVPASALFRGDNVLSLVSEDNEDPGLALGGLVVRP